MKIVNVEQGSAEWHEARRCKVTGTKLEAVMGTENSRLDLACELIAEEGTEQSKILKATAEMERGNAEEQFAAKHFEKITGKKTTEVGICIHDKYEWLALSPDRLIETPEGWTEALEIKCPDSKKLIKYKIQNLVPLTEIGLAKITKPTKAKPEPELVLKAGAPFLGIPADYKWQVVNYFIVNENLKTLYFAVYDPRFVNEDQQMFIVTVDRQNELLQEAMKEAEEALIKFREDWMRWKEIVSPNNF